MSTINYLNRIHIISILFIAATIISCGEDDDPGTSNTVGSRAVGVASGPEGSDLTLTYADGSTESIGGNQIFGWTGGQLLGGNYRKSLKIGTDKGSIQININMPKDIQFYDIMEQTHQLIPTQLLLQNSESIEEVYPELFFSFSEEFEHLGNFSGTVTFERDVTGPLTTYELVGEVDIEKSGIKISGYFWAENIEE